MRHLLTCLGYDKEEDRYTAAFVGVLEALSLPSQAALLGLDPELSEKLVAELQVSVGTGIPDARLTWGGALRILLETKVNAPLTADELVRYAEALAGQGDGISRRMVVALTRDGSFQQEVRAARETALARFGGTVDILHLTWQQVADRAQTLVLDAAGDPLASWTDEPEAALLAELVRQLRTAGLATPPLAPLDIGALNSALRVSRARLTLRNHLTRFMEGLASDLPGMPAWWKVGERLFLHFDLSIRAERWVPFSQDHQSDGKLRGATWWFEWLAPCDHSGEGGTPVPIWPPGAADGLSFRFGFYGIGREASDIAKQQLAPALRSPPARVVYRAWEGRRNYGEYLWYIEPRIDDLDAMKERVLELVGLQAQLVNHVFDSSLGQPRRN
jgi:hypothetical protein